MQFKYTLYINEENISLDKIIDVAKGIARVEISDNKRFIEKINHSRNLLNAALENNIPVYGVTTGFGKSCGNRFSIDNARQNGINLFRFHGCGTGIPIGIEETRAAIICRIISLAKGYSGISIELLQHMTAFLNNGITPIVPSEGSVGASGDLTPMSYIAASLTGERDVFYKNKKMSASKALKLTELAPYSFKPKEVLAMMNGTTTMTGIASIVTLRARNIIQAAIWATSLSVHALAGNGHHFHPTISIAKPYPGQIFISNKLNELLQTDISPEDLEFGKPETLQDPYSIRCTPQILGVLFDSLEWIDKWVETEANSANDNPLIDPETGTILMGGNFYGGHLAFAMDSLKNVLASVADMSDRQIQFMVNPNINRGLPADLVRISSSDNLKYHGFKAMSISSSALTSEALKGTMPAASFSRSTESHNQDKVSLGTIAARDAEKTCILVERVLAIHLLSAAQAFEIRGNGESRPELVKIINKIRTIAEPTFEDRPMDMDIENIANSISNSTLFNIEQNE